MRWCLCANGDATREVLHARPIRVVVAHDSGLQGMVPTLDHAVRLRVVRRGVSALATGQHEKGLSQLGFELETLLRWEPYGHAEMANRIFVEATGYSCSFRVFDRSNVRNGLS